MFWNKWKINFPFLFWVINDFVEKFHVFLFYRPKMVKNIVVLKDAQCSKSDFCIMIFFYPILSFWDMIDFVFTLVMHSGKNKLVWGLAPHIRRRGCTPGPHMLLILRRLASLVSVNGIFRKNLFPSSLLSTVKYKIDHISKTKNYTKKKSWIQKSDSEHCASFEITYFWPFLVDKNTWKLWTKS